MHTIVDPFSEAPSSEAPSSEAPSSEAPSSEAPKRVTQAERVIAKFGNARRLAAALARVDDGFKRDPSRVYRWTYSKARGGTDGLIPSSAVSAVMEAARLDGVLLTAEDMDPRAL